MHPAESSVSKTLRIEESLSTQPTASFKAVDITPPKEASIWSKIFSCCCCCGSSSKVAIQDSYRIFLVKPKHKRDHDGSLNEKTINDLFAKHQIQQTPEMYQDMYDKIEEIKALSNMQNLHLIDNITLTDAGCMLLNLLSIDAQIEESIDFLKDYKRMDRQELITKYFSPTIDTKGNQIYKLNISQQLHNEITSPTNNSKETSFARVFIEVNNMVYNTVIKPANLDKVQAYIREIHLHQSSTGSLTS